jgi:AmiR/NasT family two-component response regulator
MGSVDVPDPPCGTKPCAELLEQLAVAVERRDVIGMGKGIIMGESGCDEDAAFDILRLASMRRNVKVHTVAGEMVARRSSGP